MPLSYSQLALYRRCPKQYEYANVKKVPRPISPGESFGSSIHNTLKRWGELEVEKQPKIGRGQLTLFIEDHAHDIGAELTLTTLLNFWRQCFIAEGYESRTAMDSKFIEGEQALTHFFEWWSTTKRDVIAIEKSFKFPVPNTDQILAGRFDRVERIDGKLWIIDFKSTKPRPPEQLTTDLQLSVYALAAHELWPEPVGALTLLCINPEGIVAQSTTRSRAQLDEALAKIALIADGIASRDFTATPSIEKCTYCPYREICPSRAI